MRWPFNSRRERLRREAADWIAKLNGAPDQGEHAAFDQWYRADPDHAATYDRLAALFATAGQMRPAPSATETHRSRSGGWQSLRPGYAFAALAIAGAVVGLAVAMLGERQPIRSGADEAQATALVAAGGESRLVSLVDGSKVLLAPGSELEVAIGGKERRLLLNRGEGRFTVAHEPRPFVVAARGTEVVAHGTQFVVRLTPGGTLVSLIEGRVEVSYTPPQGGRRQPLARLEPGQRLMVPAGTAPVAPPSPANPVTARASRPAMIEFDDARLGDAVERVNRQAGGRLRLADPALADLRVTGAYRAGDADGFARGVAAALGLGVERAGDGALLLDRRG